MYGSNLHGQQFLCMEKMAQIRFAVQRVYIGSTVRLNGGEIRFPFFVSHIDDTVFGKQHSISSVACRHYAVEHIYAAFYPFKDIDRSTDAHQITGLVFRQNLVDNFDHLIHLIDGFAYCQSADSISVRSFGSHKLRRLFAQIGVNTSLNNRE